MAADRDPFFAIADATRRALLEHLWEDGPQPAGALAARFPEISREAVSRHLRILREAGLVTVRARGREAWYAIDPEPLRAVHARFLAQFDRVATDSLAALKERVEGEPVGEQHMVTSGRRRSGKRLRSP